MKKIFLTLMLTMTVVLSGCGASSSVETLQGWHFQENSGTNDYSVLFGLLDANDQPTSAAVEVGIRIVNDQDEEVYKATASVTPDDFGSYTSEARGEEYLAEIRIPEEEIAPGKASNGTVYLTVYKDDTIRFDEVNCEAMYCLPILDVQLETETLPQEISVKAYDGKVESKIQIDSISYEFEKDYTPTLSVTVLGTKTYQRTGNMYRSSYDMISYKLYDSEGYMVDSGDLFIDSVSQGDKFKDDSITFYDVTPGETYTLKFLEHGR